jgi:hypothetical protein
MRPGSPVLLLAALVLPAGAALVLAHDPAAPVTGAEPAPECEEAKRTNGWCREENVGYVASLAIRSPLLYEALDAHGHAVDPAAVACGTCRAALKSDGFCADHRMGYVGGEAYLSPLTYHLARGRAIDPAAIACRACRRHTRGIGWCDRHRVGIVGRVAFDDRQEFEELVEAYRLLEAAIRTSGRCETCAAAMVAEGYCPVHRLKYRAGQAIDGDGDGVR